MTELSPAEPTDAGDASDTAAGSTDDLAIEPAGRAARGDVPRSVWRRRVLNVLLPLLVYGGVAGAYFKPTFLDGLTYGQVDDMQRVYFPWTGIQGFGPTLSPQQDYPNSFYPRQVWLNRELRAGDLPEWNPYAFAGSPFLDNGGGITLHPVRAALALVVSPALVHDLYLFLAMATAGLGAHALARRLGARRPGAYLAGTAWMLNATFLAWSQLELMAAIIAGLPWALYGIRRWSDTRPPAAVGGSAHGAVRWVVLAGVAAGLMPLGGSVDFTLTAWLTCGLYALTLSQRGTGWRVALRDRMRWRRLAGPVTFTATAVAVGAPALLPFVQLSAYVGRQPPSAAVFEAAIAQPTWRFLRTFWPPDLPVSADRMHQMAFVGTVAGVLAVLGLLRRGPRSALGRGLVAAAFLLIANTVFSQALAGLLPTYRSFTVGRHLFLWNLGVVLLASAGFDQVIGWVRAAGSRLLPVRAAVVPAALLATGVVLVNTFQLGTYGRDINPRFSPRDAADLMPATDAIRALQATDGGLGGGRFLPVMFSDGAPVMAASLPMIFGLESGAGYESTFLAGVEATWRTVSGERLDDVLAAPMTFGYQAAFVLDKVRPELLARVGVTTLFLAPDAAKRPEWAGFVTAAGGAERDYQGRDGEVWHLTAAAPRAAVVGRVELADDVPAALERALAAGFPWQERVVLSPEPVTGRKPTPAKDLVTTAVDTSAQRPGGYVDEVAYGNDDVTLKVWAERPSYLLLRDSWAPGWTATVGGRKAPVELANGAFRAVAVPAGESVVAFHYRTPGLRIGLALTVLAALAIAVGALWTFWTDVIRRGPAR